MNHRPLLASPVTIARRRRLMAAITVVATLVMAVTVLFAPAADAASTQPGDFSSVVGPPNLYYIWVDDCYVDFGWVFDNRTPQTYRHIAAQRDRRYGRHVLLQRQQLGAIRQWHPRREVQHGRVWDGDRGHRAVAGVLCWNLPSVFVDCGCYRADGAFRADCLHPTGGQRYRWWLLIRLCVLVGAASEAGFPVDAAPVCRACLTLHDDCLRARERWVVVATCRRWPSRQGELGGCRTVCDRCCPL
jgi:hypothetical protein